MKLFSCLFKLVFGLVVVVIAFGIVGVLLVDHFAVGMASKVLQQRSGFTMAAGQQSISALSGAADLQDVLVSNPDRFGAKDFLHFTQLKVLAEPTSVLGKRLIIDELVVDVDSFAIVYNKDGELNLMAIKEGLAGITAPAFTIKKFTLRIKSAKVLDFKHGDGKPAVTTMNYDRTFTDVNESNYTKVVVQVGLDLSLDGFSVLTDALKGQLLDPGTYLDAAKGVGGAVLNGANDAVQGLGNAVKKLF